jgi:hypothetical protein
MEQSVQLPRRLQAVAERLLHRHPAACRQRLGQRLDGRREERRRQGEVGGHRPLAALHRGPHRAAVRHVGAAVLQAVQQAAAGVLIRIAVFLQLAGNVVEKPGLIPLLRGQAENSERLGEVTHGEELGQRRHQIAAGEITGGAEDDERMNHRRLAPASLRLPYRTHG